MANSEEQRGMESATWSTSLSTAMVALGEDIRTYDPKKLAQLVRRRLKASQEFKENYLIAKWLRTYYFVLGYQRIKWSKGRWYPVKVHEDRRISVNLLRSRLMNMVSTEIQHEPGFEVQPMTGEFDARADARMAEKILRYVLDADDLETERVLMAVSRGIFGGVFTKTYFDPTKGRRVREQVYAMEGEEPVLVDGERVPLLKPDGSPAMSYAPPEGRVRIEMRDYLTIQAPPTARGPKVDDLPWMGERRAVPIDEIYDVYNYKAKPDTKANDQSYLCNLDIGRMFHEDIPHQVDEKAKDSTFIYEIHCRPADVPGFEEGRKIVVVDNEVLANEPGELPSGELPYQHYPVYVVPMSLYGATPLEDGVEPQIEYNRGRSHVSHVRSTLPVPFIEFDEGAISEEKITAGGRIIPRRSGYGKAIDVHSTPGISSAVVAELQHSRTDLDDATGNHAYSRGQMLGASPQPATTVETLINADAGDLKPGLKIARQSWAKAGDAALELVREHYQTPRLGYIAGEGDDVETFMFSGTDLIPELKVFVKEGSEIPHMKDSLRTQYVELAKSGVLEPYLQDPAGMEHFANLFDMPSPSSLMNLTNMDQVQQEQEILRMLRGEMVEVDQDEDHWIHHKVFVRFKKTDTWRILKQSQPQIAQALMQHDAEHLRMDKEQRQAAFEEQARQAMAMGQGPPPPEGA